MPVQRLHVPRMRRLQRLGVGVGAEGLGGPSRPPHLHRVAATGLGQAVEQGGHVAHVVGVQVRQEHLRRRGHRQAQPGEVLQRTRAQVEEEQVALRVAHLDQHAGRRLRGSHERVAAAQDRDPDLVRGQCLRPRHEGRCEESFGRADHWCRGQRNVASLARELGQVGDLVTHGCCNPFIGGWSNPCLPWTSVESVPRATGRRPHPSGMRLLHPDDTCPYADVCLQRHVPPAHPLGRPHPMAPASAPRLHRVICKRDLRAAVPAVAALLRWQAKWRPGRTPRSVTPRARRPGPGAQSIRVGRRSAAG